MTLFQSHCVAKHSRRKKKKKKKLLQILLLLRLKVMVRERNYVTNVCLSCPHKSAWMKVYEEGIDQNFINLTSLNRKAFDELLILFAPHYDAIGKWKPGGSGRPRKLIEPHSVLGMLLSFYTDSCGLKTLCLNFGVPPSTASRTLKKAEACLLLALESTPSALILWPTVDEQVEWARLVEAKNSLVKGRWGFIDGKNYKVQKPSCAELQNAMYNGWLHATLITGVLCFGANGTLVWGKHNVVGSWNDGDMSRPFQRKIARTDINVDGHGVLSDSAFPVSGDCFRRIMTPLKENEELKITDPEVRQMALKLSNAITSMRQPAEWGMGAVEKVYRRLLLPLPYDKVVRGNRLRIIHKLYNFRVRTTGISQIKNYFYTEN
jgi:hypothetical protein